MTRSGVALLVATVVTTAVVTGAAVHGLTAAAVVEPEPVSWSPGETAPAVAVYADYSSRSEHCGGYVSDLPAGRR